MRLTVPLLALVLSAAASAAHADTLTVNYTANGVAAYVVNEYAVQSTSFSEFDPSIGTLNSITIALSGTATSTDQNPRSFDDFYGIFSASNLRKGLARGSGTITGPGTFAISASGIDPYPYFEGTGSAAVALLFTGATTTSDVNGTLTYNYTPAVTPEPSSLVLLSTGLLSALGIARRRFR